ncbi:MAG: hypothetical protein ABSG32_09225 [Terriglobia bacterium]|jgi:hypothetical protein
MNLRRTTVLILLLLVLGKSAEAQSPYLRWKHGPPADTSYFPIAVWLQDPEYAAQYQAAGINVYVGLWEGPTEQQLSDLAKMGMPVICEQNAVGLAHKNDPIIVGWMHGDEPDNLQEVTDPKTGKKSYGPPVPPALVVREYQSLRAADPTRPVMLNLGQGVANDEWRGRGADATLDVYPDYIKGADIISFDVYPVTNIGKPDGENYLWYVAKGVDRLVKWSGGEGIVWNALECTHIENPQAKVTPAQLRAEVWMSLVHGSRGIIYFVHEFKPQSSDHALLGDPPMLAAVTGVNAQIRRIAPLLNSPTVEGVVTVASSSYKVPIDVMVKRHGDSIYLFAVGMRNAATTGSFSLPTLPPEAQVRVLDENRTLVARNGKFTDDFKAYEVHLYQIMVSPPKPDRESR